MQQVPSRGTTRGYTGHFVTDSRWPAVALALALAAGTARDAPAASPVRVDPARVAAAPSALQAQLREDPFVYFRFLNTAWAARVCEAFQADLNTLPAAILQGDAHVGQYAFTATARGLDDFDDAARGPSVLDLVRFLGSVDLITRQRGWTAEREHLFDRFLEGYARGVADPAYMPPDPAVVTRLRARPARTREQFLTWGDSLMVEPTALEKDRVTRSLALLDAFVRELRPHMPPGYFGPKKIGWLHMGVGSALTPKVLIRIEGPSPLPGDDVLLEAKKLSGLDGVPCLQVPISGEALRVIAAAEQIGRIRHDILAVWPRRDDQGPEVRDWVVRTWDETYVEVTPADFAGAEELGELAHDAGAQLGAANQRQAIPVLEAQVRQAELAALRRLGPRIRATARGLTEDLLAGWEEFRAAP